MVGVGVGIHHQRQCQIQLPQKCHIPLGLLEYRVNKNRPPGSFIGQQIRIGGRGIIK